MGRERNYICEFYVRAHECTKGRDAEVHGVCQTCPKYRKKAGAKPIRVDNRRTKLEKINRKEQW